MVHVLDTRQLGRPGIIAATAIESEEGLVLFDTGPESTFANIVAELRGIGHGVNDVRHVFLSHIHFDHAGAAWRFAELGATVYVHPRGAPHLLNPTKLIRSATQIFGDDMGRFWGQIAAVPEERLTILQDMETVRIGRLEVQAIATPGHASHHHVYRWENNLFGGDVAGVRLGDGPPIPPFVPPELNIEQWLESIARIRALAPANLYLPHFGRVPGSVSAHLDALEERVRRWSIWLRDRIRLEEAEPEMIAAFSQYEHDDLRNAGGDDESVQDYEAADPSYMAVAGAVRYWRKHHPEELQASL